ncbi:putative pectinesterase [Tanacetum coccineum]
MTFRNTAGPEGQQAVALLSGSDQSVFYRCSIQGYQDTLYTFSSIQFYKECQIYGTVDFIFGDALAVFQDCEILFRKPIPGGGLVVTAHGRINTNQSTGYSFQGCKITAAADLKPVIGQYSKAFLGRPWFPHASTIYMQSFIDDLVDPRGWLDNQGYKKTTFYGEYNNYGPGSSTNKRVKWHGYHVIKDPKIAGLFTVSKFISGNQWLPETGPSKKSPGKVSKRINNAEGEKLKCEHLNELFFELDGALDIGSDSSDEPTVGTDATTGFPMSDTLICYILLYMHVFQMPHIMGGFDPYLEDYVTSYYNRFDAQKALKDGCQLKN